MGDKNSVLFQISQVNEQLPLVKIHLESFAKNTYFGVALLNVIDSDSLTIVGKFEDGAEPVACRLVRLDREGFDCSAWLFFYSPTRALLHRKYARMRPVVDEEPNSHQLLVSVAPAFESTYWIKTSLPEDLGVVICNPNILIRVPVLDSSRLFSIRSGLPGAMCVVLSGSQNYYYDSVAATLDLVTTIPM